MAPTTIAPARPKALPADFREWDREEIPETLPEDFNGFDPVTSFDASPTPHAQEATQSSAMKQLPNTNLPTGPLNCTGTDHLFQSLPSSDKGNLFKVIVVTFGAILVLLALLPFIYPKLSSRSDTPKPAVVQQGRSPQLSLQTKPSPATPEKLAQTVQAFDSPSKGMSYQRTGLARIPGDMRKVVALQSSSSTGTSDKERLDLGAIDGSRSIRPIKIESPKTVIISTGAAAGQPSASISLYPEAAKSAGISGTVVLNAAISKTGNIESLRVVSGPSMLRQTALDAIKTRQYRPYLLNNQPVEVETTVNVIFTLSR
jgi:periplasmic protein TonB